MLENLNVGSQTFPDQTLADKAGDALLNCIKKALISDLQCAFAAAVNGTKLSDAYIFESAIPYNYEWLIMQNNIKFPALAVYRTSTSSTQFSIWMDNCITVWNIDYILPQLNTQELKLDKIRHSVAKSVQGIVHRFGHPEYNDGYYFDEFYKIRFLSCAFGNLEISGDILHPTLRMQIETQELIDTSSNELNAYPLIRIENDLFVEDYKIITAYADNLDV
jgi:hypothetical protein